MKLAVLLSGRGSNFEALLSHRANLPEIALVLSDQPEAPGLQIARQASLPAVICAREQRQSKQEHEASMIEALAGIDAVILAGFMRILSADFIAQFQAVLNIHPSLLPAFPGLDTHARAIKAQARVHGCTVHLVDAGIDTGPIVAQSSLAVRADEAPEALAARVLRLEHGLYGPTLVNFFKGRAKQALAEPPQA